MNHERGIMKLSSQLQSEARCSENIQQIYRRTPMSKCDFNEVALQLYSNRTSAWVFSSKLATYFQNTFYQEHLWRAVSV